MYISEYFGLFPPKAHVFDRKCILAAEQLFATTETCTFSSLLKKAVMYNDYCSYVLLYGKMSWLQNIRHVETTRIVDQIGIDF